MAGFLTCSVYEESYLFGWMFCYNSLKGSLSLTFSPPFSFCNCFISHDTKCNLFFCFLFSLFSLCMKVEACAFQVLLFHYMPNAWVCYFINSRNSSRLTEWDTEMQEAKPNLSPAFVLNIEPLPVEGKISSELKWQIFSSLSSPIYKVFIDSLSQICSYIYNSNKHMDRGQIYHQLSNNYFYTQN